VCVRRLAHLRSGVNANACRPPNSVLSPPCPGGLPPRASWSVQIFARACRSGHNVSCRPQCSCTFTMFVHVSRMPFRPQCSCKVSLRMPRCRKDATVSRHILTGKGDWTLSVWSMAGRMVRTMCVIKTIHAAVRALRECLSWQKRAAAFFPKLTLAVPAGFRSEPKKRHPSSEYENFPMMCHSRRVPFGDHPSKLERHSED